MGKSQGKHSRRDDLRASEILPLATDFSGLFWSQDEYAWKPKQCASWKADSKGRGGF